MAIKDQIDRILVKRKKKAEELRERKALLLKIRSNLESFRGLYSEAWGIPDDELRGQYSDVFARLSDMANVGTADAPVALEEEIETEVRRLEEGIRRFSRDYISIATIGKERQGKSRFLQAVGNLDDQIIPAYASTSCTGATSIIYNRPEMKKDTVEATITFRKKEQFLAMVREYIDRIDPGYLKDRSFTFADVNSNSMLTALKKTVDKDPGNADKRVALGHLSKIVGHFSEISNLFGQEPYTTDNKKEIEQLVAQNNGVGLDEQTPENPRIEYYKYLAVERAEIYCPFYEDCGDLVLVDTIGILDTKIGIEEAMLNTVDRECDAAIVVTMPDSDMQQPDIDLYNMLRERFAKRDIRKWLFYLSNKNKARNNPADLFVKKANEIFDVAFCRDIDCTDKDQVRDEFMIPLLNTLLANLDDIDRVYLEDLEQTERRARKDYQEFLSKLPSMKNFDVGIQQGLSASKKGKACYEKLSADLVNSVVYWGKEKDEPNSTLWNEVQQILDDLDEMVPDAESLQRTIDQNGSLLPRQLWTDALHYVRNEITDRFIAIDGILEEETRKFKNSLVRSLYDELRNLSRTQSGGTEPWGEDSGRQGEPEERDFDGEEPDMVEWLKNIMDHVINDKPQYRQIYKAFRFMYRFEFNTRAQLIQEVRRQLYIINPICDDKYAEPFYNFHRDNAGKEVSYYLTSRMSIIEENLRHTLKDLYRAPNQAFYAAAEEFYDRLTFANSLNGSAFEDMKDVWGEFFMEYSSQLWTANAKKYDQVNELIQKYRQLKGSLEEEGRAWTV